MLTLKSAATLRTVRHIKSFHASATSTGVPMRHAEAQRLNRELRQLGLREARRQWLDTHWRDHLVRVQQRLAASAFALSVHPDFSTGSEVEETRAGAAPSLAESVMCLTEELPQSVDKPEEVNVLNDTMPSEQRGISDED